MNKPSRLARVSVAFAVVGALAALTRSGWLPVLGMSLGLAAVGVGAAACWSNHRAPAAPRGRGLAVLGTCLGAGVTVLSLFVLLSMLVQQFVQEQRRQTNWHPAVQQGGARAVSSLPDAPPTNFTSNLPLIVLNTAGRSVSREVPTLVRAQVFDVVNGRSSLTGAPAYDGPGSLHLRGTTTLHLPKRSYSFRTLDASTNQASVALLGLPADDDWVLYAPFEDKTMIRDVLAYELARAMGHYAPRTRYVELFVNTSGRPASMRDYVGVYVLIEKIKRGRDRVNIAKLEPNQVSEPEISGGYIFKRDHNDRAEPRFHTSLGGPYFYVYPKPETITPEQKAWLKRYLAHFEAALAGDAFRDPTRGYRAYLDVDSFIDAHWLIEAGKNVDGFRYSAFLTKDRGGKLQSGPPWDWNRSFGNANYYGGWQTQGWYWTNLRPEEISWYLRLREDPDFERRCRERWFELRKDVLNPARVTARVDALAAQLEEAQQRNFRRWPILGEQITCNYYVGDSYAEEVRWLKRWIERRIAWIDSQVGSASK